VRWRLWYLIETVGGQAVVGGKVLRRGEVELGERRRQVVSRFSFAFTEARPAVGRRLRNVLVREPIEPKKLSDFIELGFQGGRVAARRRSPIWLGSRVERVEVRNPVASGTGSLSEADQ
jgi:hypothetical protein